MRMYIVSYSKYTYEDEQTFHVFVTDNEKKAIEYVNRFNGILDKWSKYYSRYTGRDRYIKDEYEERYGRRWWELKHTNEAYYEEVEFR